MGCHVTNSYNTHNKRNARALRNEPKICNIFYLELDLGKPISYKKQK